MKKFLKILLILIFPAALFFGVYLNAVSGPISGNNKDGIVFVVKTGEGGNKIAENLYQKNLIKYKIYEDATPNDIVQKMLKNLDQKLTPKMRDDIKKQGKTIYEIITMASIIEKEVRSFGDMKLVSGVFWNRINSGRALESCASLAYILGVNKPQYTIEDTNIDSPYNTYKNPGLPPGPIANPGFNAITAAIYPDKTDYNYFLSASTGETIFSKTYDEHLRNKAKYLK